MAFSTQFLDALRQQFPALSRQWQGQPVAYFDGPAGTQVPKGVIDAIAGYLSHNNANHGGLFATSRDSDRMLRGAHQAVADLLGAEDPETVSFGPNMTTLTFALSRALARTWRGGDQVLVTRLDHDANVTPWVLAARDAGAEVRYVDIHREDCTLDMDDFHAKLTERTRLVAVGCASNSVGTINPVAEICRAAREVGAVSFLDAVHFAPHALLDVAALGCDFLACSAYKFFGPHIGVQWGRRELLEELSAYKLRPAPDSLPGKWMTGTQNHECIAGVAAAIDYLSEIGYAHADAYDLTRRQALRETFQVVAEHERELTRELLQGLAQIEDVKVWGITELDRLPERFPTLSITHRRLTPAQMATQLGEQGLFVWHGNYYALQLSETLGVEPEGMLRIGLVHYNTIKEVRRLLAAIADLTCE
jgi:cysteine desulfurase family protein (TIGR01976 family)